MHLAAFMPDIKPWVTHCRFYNCTHLHEPGCGVISSIKSANCPDGITEDRYKIYSNLFAELSRPKY
jgi:ribosome biogenesis GTPase